MLKKLKNAKKVQRGPTNRPTNQPTNQQTDIARCRVTLHATKYSNMFNKNDSTTLNSNIMATVMVLSNKF